MSVEEIADFDELITTGTVSPFLRVSSASTTASVSSATMDDPDLIHTALRDRLINMSQLHNSPRTVSITSDNDKEPIDITIFPSIREVADALKLTDDQKCAFYIMARGYLQSLSYKDVTPEHPYNTEGDPDCEDDDRKAVSREIKSFETLRIGPRQAVLKLQGKAGTGKSFIIRGLLALEKGWLREKTILIVTITGVAAVNVNGVTIESLLHLTNDDFYKKVHYLIQ
jgi:hypothetical protein